MNTHLSTVCGSCQTPVPQHDTTLPTPHVGGHLVYIVQPGSMWCGNCKQSYTITGYRIIIKQVA